MIERAAIQKFVDEVGRLFQPEKIILFGSQVRGDTTPDSDVDILVLMEHAGRNIEKAIEIRRATKRDFALDIRVRKPAEFLARTKMGDQFLREINEHGKVFFARDSC